MGVCSAIWMSFLLPVETVLVCFGYISPISELLLWCITQNSSEVLEKTPKLVPSEMDNNLSGVPSVWALFNWFTRCHLGNAFFLNSLINTRSHFLKIQHIHKRDIQKSIPNRHLRFDGFCSRISIACRHMEYLS